MSVTAEQNGTQTASIGTEHTLCDVDAAGVFTLHVDCVNMAAGDLLEIRVKQIILTGGTRRVAYFQAYYDAQATDDLVKITDPIGNELTDSGSLRFTLKQVRGTGRDFPFKVLKYS
jgi:hypothetical protein